MTTFGDDREEAVARAIHALEEAIAARIHDRKDIPTPSQGETCAILPTLTSVKVMLYREYARARGRQGGVGTSAWDGTCHRWTGCWTFSTGHGWTMMDAALGAIGRRLQVTTAIVPEYMVASVEKETDSPI